MPTDPQHLLPAGKRTSSPILIAIAAFIIGILAASAWFFELRLEKMKDQATDTASSTTSSATIQDSSHGAVAVHDQQAGDSVLIDSVDVPAPGVWIAVAEIRGSDLGNILGAARALGPADNTFVPLLRATIPGKEYAVVLYRDNGDGSFDHTSDSVYVDFASGERVVAPFKTNP
jgi:hypothetical protein